MTRPNIDVAVNGAGDYLSALATYSTVVLKPNVVDNRNVLTQNMISSKHTKYIIKWDYELEGATIVVPEDCLIEFNGGSLHNGTLVGEETILLYDIDRDRILKNVTLEGTFKESNWDIHTDEQTITEQNDVIMVKEGGIQGKHLNRSVVNEDDLQLTSDNKLQFADRPNTEGMGRVILRKNSVVALPFDGFVENITIEQVGSTRTPRAIYFDTTNGVFVALIGDLMPKYYSAWVDNNKYSTSGSLANGDCFKWNNTYYEYNDGTLLATTTPTKNLLTQEMVSKKNTIYVIQYDFDLDGESITIPAGCTLKFEGGNLSNGTLNVNGAEVLPNYNKLQNDTLIITGNPALGTVQILNNGKATTFNGTKWVESDGATAKVLRSGTTAQRPMPSDIYSGFQYFDTTLGKPIWLNDAQEWVDATGATV